MIRAKGSRATFRLKIVVLFLFLLALAFIQSDSIPREIRGQVAEMGRQKLAPASNTLPPDPLVEELDRVIQERFFTTPQFGIYRIAPRRPTNPHFEHFSANTDAERAAVAAFEAAGWDVGIYVFGRRVTPRIDTKKTNDYDIRYRLFEPIPVTPNLKPKDLRESEKLADEIKHAFVEFQKPGSPNENDYRFDGGNWSYVARPVRAEIQSCLQCHKDYVITERLGDGKFRARPRKLGDANGVLVYSFAKRGE